jgi:TolA-binding protein
MLGIIEYRRSAHNQASTLFEEALRFSTDRRGEILSWLGKSEYKREEYQNAVAILEAAKSVHITPEISYWYGLSLLRLERYDEADSVFSSLPSNQQWGLRSLLLKGYTLQLMGLDEGAEEIFQSIPSSSHSAEDSSLIELARLHLGSIAMEKERYEKAIEQLAFAKEARSQETADDALLRKGWSHYQLSQWDEAADVFQVLVDRSPKSKSFEAARYFLGETEYKRRRYGDALHHFKALLEEAPDSRYASHSLYASAYCHYHMDSLSTSVEQFKEYIDKYPESDLLSHARYRIGLSRYHLGDYSGAVDALKPLASEKTPPLSNEAHYLTALSYFALTDYDSVLDELKRLKEYEDPLRPEAQKLLGDALFQEEEYWRAIEAYKKLADLSSGGNAPSAIVDEGRYQVERSLLKLGLYSSPVTMLKAYVKKYPESAKAPRFQMEIAQYYLQTEQYSRAIEAFERFLELFSGRVEKAEAILGLAKAHEKIGAIEEAHEQYLRAPQESPLAPMAWFSAAHISYRLGDLGRAISECQNLIDKFQGTEYAEQALHMQGNCFLRLRRYEEAMLVHEKLLSEYPSSRGIEELRFRIALLVLQEGLIEDGLKMLNTDWSSDSLKGEALLKTGAVLFELGQYRDAVAKLLDASEHLSLHKRAQSLFKAGEALELTGEHSQASLLYRDALQVVVDEKLRTRILRKMESLESYLEAEESE